MAQRVIIVERKILFAVREGFCITKNIVNEFLKQNHNTSVVFLQSILYSICIFL